MAQTSSTLVLLPIVIPLFGMATSLLLYRHPRQQAAWSFGAIFLSTATSAILLYQVWQRNQAVVFQLGAWPAPVGISIVGDMLSATLAFMAQFVLTTGFLYALGSRDKVILYPGFFPLFLGLAAGLTGALLSGDLFNLFVFAELLVISGTVLTAISDDKYGTEAAYKYFYVSLLASISLLIASGSLYASYGTLNIADLAQRISASPDQPLTALAMVLLMVTFMIKGAVFPFHFWQPDFHTTSPTPVSAMLSSVVVKLGVYGFIRMTTLIFLPYRGTIELVLIVLGAFGVLFGGLSAIGTNNVKRMLAYSTVGQVGFILVAIGWGTPGALAAAVLFTFNHSLIKSAMLMLSGFVASRSAIKSTAFSVLRGIGKQLPFAGALFLIGGLALAGIPPTNGFLNKLALFRSGIEAGEFASLAFVAAASALTLIYVMRAFQQIWWQTPAEDVATKSSGDRLTAPAILIALSLLLGLWGEPLVRLAQDTAVWLNNPVNYIQLVFGV